MSVGNPAARVHPTPAHPASTVDRHARAAAPVRVAVCVATFRRPALLAGLLESLGALALQGRAEVLVVVVDNDVRETARATVAAARRRLGIELHYLVEPERNIALARNRGVARALERNARFVAFVDDDGVPRPGWLEELLEVQQRAGADAVQGTVVPRFVPAVPRWTRRLGFFATVPPADGRPLTVASTNNVLASSALLAGGGPFDPAFGLTGGEDSAFFLRASREGARIVAAPAAVVDEHIDELRGRASWVLRRAFRVGNVAVFCEKALPAPRRRLPMRVARATLRLAASAALLPVSLAAGRPGVLWALWGVSYGLGCWAALAGYRYAEYRHPGR